MAKFVSSLKAKLIYVFRINDKAHAGCLKVGEATLSDEENLWGLTPSSHLLNVAAKKRINQYTQTAGIVYELLYTELSIFTRGGAIMSLTDGEVHKVLERSGIKKKVFDTENKANEWFITDLETVKNAIHAAKEGRMSLSATEVSTERSPIIFRPEQRDAIDKTKKQFKKSNQMLWNAKMRFGKTLSGLQVVKEMNFARTLILTHRPVVDAGWFEDFTKIFYDTPKYRYGSKNNGESHASLERLVAKEGIHYVYFASMQDLRGSSLVGGNFDKNDQVFATPWDLIIVDEAHEGTKTELGEAVMKELTKTQTKILRLSGTPFNLFDDYKEDEIYTWDYVMEQRAKAEWDLTHFGDPNPYAGLPRLNIYTYDLNKLLDGYGDSELAFNFREFFRVDETGEFVHKKDVESFLNLICKKDSDSNYPYSTEEYRDNFRHSLWIVPGVKAAKALSAMLQSHAVFSQFQVVNVAGEGDEDQERDDALELVNKAIGNKPEETYTITLSCGRLTTGVSVKAWTAVFMLAGSFSTAASSYMQTIFRVQTPATIGGKVKEECFVFDFAPDRTLKVIAETAKISAKAGKTTSDDRKAMGDFINFCPIIAYEGSKMISYDVPNMLQQLKKVYVERVVRNGFEDGYLYNDDLMRLDSLELQEFAKLKKIIGSTKAMPKSGEIDINNQGFTNEEHEQLEKAEEKKRKKKELTEEEKRLLEEKAEKRKNRDTAVSILRGISIRMPLMIYGADLTDESKEITLDNFTSLIDDGSWDEFMPKGVTKEIFEQFKKYYDPEVFCSAGKRIRAMAKAADALDIEDRIERITAIFNTFRNPDKETVLTPWRVVNMHLGDCLGGWVFYDETKEKQIVVPRFVDNGDVTREVFASDARILEINSKSGLYPLYMAYSIYRTRLQEKLDEADTMENTPERHLKVWDAVLRENIFVLCKTQMAKSITRRTLRGFRPVKVNTRYYEDLINQISHKTAKFISQMKQGKNYWKANEDNDMKFTAIVGNPPYQVMDGGAKASATPIYNLFVDVAKLIKPRTVSMIMPAKWYTDGKGLGEFRTNMLNDKRIAKLVDYEDSRDCFSNVDIAGGVCYFLWDNEHNGNCEFTSICQGVKKSSLRDLSADDSFIRNVEAVGIINKITALTNEFYSSRVSTQKPFGLRTYVTPLEHGDIILKYNKGKGPYESSLITTGREMINQWKVTISYLTAEHAGQTDKEGRKRILSSLDILVPNEICTETYMVVDSFDTREEAEHLFLYLETRFVRFLISQLASTQHLSKEKFAYVPILNFANTCDIDWNKSVAEIDQQLYAKYGLDESEIAFIESKIKPME